MGEPVTTARTDRPTSGYARYIGRVGGLAFALGVGAAVLTGTAVAWADTSDPAGGSGASESSSSSSQHPGTDAGPARTRAERKSNSGSDTDSGSDSEAAAPAADSDEEAEPSTTRRVEKLVDRRRAAKADRAAARALAPSTRLAAAAAVEPSPSDSFFSNQTPTLAYDPGDNTVVAGNIDGDLHPDDPDSTRLKYTATKPANGTVVIDSDGTFVYTPGNTYTGQDRFDVTVSDARSGFHIHGAEGLLSLFSFGLLGNSGHRTTETVFIGFERAVVASGLDAPVDFRWLPDDRIVVAEKGGAIKVIENGVVREQPLIELSVDTSTERGISGLAVDPNFATNGYIYVAYTTTAIRNRLSRFTVEGNTAGSELMLLETTDASAPNHHGGALGFGPDGKLYWGVGDNANGANAQDLTNIHGKILRLNSDGSTPSDNPALGPNALPQIYAYGLRNPFRLTFTPTGKLLVADVGNAAFEELNLVTAGGNYGWPGAEGICTSSCTGKINPIYTYAHGAGAAFTSVLVYNGGTLGADYQNKVFIADLVKGWIKVLTCTPGFTSCGDAQDFDPQAGSTLVLAQGPDGNIYQLTYSGELVRIAPAGSPPV